MAMTPAEILAAFDNVNAFKRFAADHQEMPMPNIIDKFFGPDISADRFALLAADGYRAQYYPNRIPR